jgi:hypothetical protein
VILDREELNSLLNEWQTTLVSIEKGVTESQKAHAELEGIRAKEKGASLPTSFARSSMAGILNLILLIQDRYF